MRTPLTLDTPIGPIHSLPGHAETARAMTDEALAAHLNDAQQAGRPPDPTTLAVAMQERPHVRRRRLNGGGVEWYVRRSSFGPPHRKARTIADVVRGAVKILTRGRTYWNDRLHMRPAEVALLRVLEPMLQEAAGPVSVAAMIAEARDELGVRNNWRVYDAAKFMREHGAIECTGRQCRDLYQSARYEWTL